MPVRRKYHDFPSSFFLCILRNAVKFLALGLLSIWPVSLFITSHSSINFFGTVTCLTRLLIRDRERGNQYSAPSFSNRIHTAFSVIAIIASYLSVTGLYIILNSGSGLIGVFISLGFTLI